MTAELLSATARQKICIPRFVMTLWARNTTGTKRLSHGTAVAPAPFDLIQYGHYVYRDVDPIARLAPSLTEHAGCSDLRAGCSDLTAAVGA
jgi:hypothetical protein